MVMMAKFLCVAVFLVKSTSITVSYLARCMLQAMVYDLFWLELKEILIAHGAALILVKMLDLGTLIIVLMCGKMKPLFTACHESPLRVATERAVT
jgi:hypothetical protein